MVIANLVSDELHTFSWNSHNHPHWCFVLKPQHCRLLTLRWDRSFPTILTLANVQPPETTEHTSTEHLRVAKLQLLFQQTVLDEIYFCFPVLWSNLLGFIRGHFNAKVLISGWSHHPPPLLKKTHFLYFLCFHVYITLCFSPLQMSSTLKSTSAGVPSLWDNGTRPLCAPWINHHSVYSKLIINYSTDTFPQASLVEERSEHTTRD